jgi:nitroreductase/NAD-dependent dihydropyrimidine dehydrogenase PreA subunit
MYDIQIQDHCTRCGACVAVCPARVFAQEADVRVASPGGCILCGHCVAVCPVDAVAHHGFHGEEFPPIPDGARLEPDSLAGFLRARRSVREFRDKPVAREMLEKLLDIARYAPTASNVQGVRYALITDATQHWAISRRIVRWMALAGRLARIPGVLALAARGWGRQRLETYLCALDGMLEAVERGRDPIFYNASALIVTHAHKANAFGIEDSAYATYQLALAAHAMGLGTCMIGFLTTVSRYDPAVRRMAGVPKGHRMTTALVVGYPIYRYRRLVPRRLPRVQWLGDEERRFASDIELP